jgi:5'-nucleotidase
MAYDLTDKLVIAISSRALFDLEEENALYDKDGLEAYYSHQLEHIDDPLRKGTGFRFIQNLLKINQKFDNNLIEVIILSRNNAATGLRIGRTLEYYDLPIERSGWTAGTSVVKYLEPFKVDLFLSAFAPDVEEAIAEGFAAATILPHTSTDESESDIVKIAFDGDAVIFGDESERVYQEQGLEAFIAHERDNAHKPLSKGPFFKLLKTISEIQERFPLEESPIRTALVTARNYTTHERVLETLNVWGVRVDEAFFQGGVQKYEVIRAFGADIFFDDQDAHLEPASQSTPSAKVPIVPNS